MSDAPTNGAVQHKLTPNGPVEHHFDPEASPMQKGAIAAKGRVVPTADSSTKQLSLDPSVNGSGPVPTITVEDADKDTEQPEKQAPPGQFPTTLTPLSRVGWRAVSGIDTPPEGEEKEKNIIETYLSEQYYGQWYHSAAIIFFAVFASHFITRFRLGWGWLFITLAICNTYYVSTMSRVRRRARDDIQRELVKTRLASEHESADWINNFLDRFWLIYEPVLSATIVSSVDQILSTSTPAFLDSLRLSTFTLGTKAPRIDKVRTFPKTPEDIIIMDWGLSFTPNDISDLTPRQAAQKVNPKIVLSVRVGKGLATAAMPILIEDITFSGLMRIKMKLVPNFPHVQIVDISFLEQPVIDYVLKPVGGDTFGFDIGHIPGLSSFIRDMVHATLGPMMYDPNVFTLNLEQLLSGVPLDTAIGVVQVKIDAARSLKGSKMGGGSPDPFVTLSINDREELARTKYKHSTFNPTWLETKFILINSLQESLVLNVIDYNEHRKDTAIGAATFELQKLVEDATQENIELPLLKDGKEKGRLRFDVSFYPVLKSEVVDGKERMPETNVGIVRLTIHQAKELDASKSLSGDLNPFARLILGSEPTHRTQIIKHTNNPVWESAHEFLCSDKHASKLTLQVTDDRDFLKDPVVGNMTVMLQDLLDADVSAGRDWWPLSGCKSGKIRLSAQWKPLNMAGVISGADKYVPPIGVMRCWLQKATDVKNVEAALGGKSDPYVRVQINNITKARTEVINNNLNPVWDQIVYVPVHSLKESILFEVMDYQHLSKDRSLGTVELRVSDFAHELSDNPEYHFQSTGKKETVASLKIDGNGNMHKGELHYVAEFVPALALKNVHFDADENELLRAAKGGRGARDSEQTIDSGASSRSSSPCSVKEDKRVTVTHPIGSTGRESLESTPSVPAVATNTAVDGAADAKSEEVPGLELTKEELLKHQSGIIIFNIVSGQLLERARLEVLLDDGYWPAFSTIKPPSTRAQWQHVGEGFIKELDFGRVWLRLNENGEGEKDDIIAEWKGDAKKFLEDTLDRRNTFMLMTEDERGHSTVEIEARYVPVPVTLEPRESINNQGVLHVQLLDGKDIRAADRGGKSDPFAVFTLHGQKVFKSQVKKKTVNPEWSEDFTVNVPSRVAADFTVELFDWNQIEQATSLGVGSIHLADLEPFEAAERIIPLTDKHGEKGHVRLGLVFRPEIIMRERKNTSTFSAAGRAMTHIGSMPFDAGKGVIHGVGGIFKKDFVPFGGFGKHEKHGSDANSEHGSQSGLPAQSHNLNAAAAAFPSLSADHHGASHATAAAPSEPGTLRVTVLDAKELPGDCKAYAIIRVGDKEQKTRHTGKSAAPEWNESYVFAAGPLTPKMHIWVYDHKTLGKDKVLGEAEVDIWQHIQLGKTSSAEVPVTLGNGQSLLRLRLEFDADVNPVGASASVSSFERNTTLSMPSPSRFSIRGRRPNDDN